ncbi:MAG: response regulator transcription factor [Chloroflexota bacterium]
MLDQGTNHRIKLLIVEDDADTAEMLTTFFQNEGYDTQTVAWGEEALTACRQAPPDAVVLDVRLPDIDGFEVCRRLRDSFATARIPIVFLTEKNRQVDKITGLELGGIDYLTKPFDVKELKLRVRNALYRTSPW